MPKFKISKTVRDRFRVTKNGKVLRRTIGQRHLKTSKRKTRLYRGKKSRRVSLALTRTIKKLLGK